MTAKERVLEKYRAAFSWPFKFHCDVVVLRNDYEPAIRHAIGLREWTAREVSVVADIVGTGKTAAAAWADAAKRLPEQKP